MPEYRKGEFMSVNEPAPPVEARIPGRVLRVLASPDWGLEIEATLAAAYMFVDDLQSILLSVEDFNIFTRIITIDI